MKVYFKHIFSILFFSIAVGSFISCDDNDDVATHPKTNSALIGKWSFERSMKLGNQNIGYAKFYKNKTVLIVQYDAEGGTDTALYNYTLSGNTLSLEYKSKFSNYTSNYFYSIDELNNSRLVIHLDKKIEKRKECPITKNTLSFKKID